MNEAKERKRAVVFITDDRKEDWYRREHGLTLGARYELRDEMFAEADVPLLIMTTETFLYHAEKYLDAEVSQETVDQAKELPLLSYGTLPRGTSIGRYILSEDIDVVLDPSGPAFMDEQALANFLGSYAGVQRAAFETALKVSPLRSGSDDINRASKYIANYLGSGHATAEEMARAAAWIAVRDAERQKQEGEQERQGEQPARGLVLEPLARLTRVRVTTLRASVAGKQAVHVS